MDDIEGEFVLVPVCKIKQTYTKYIALCWVYEYLKLKHQEFKEKKQYREEMGKDDTIDPADELFMNKLSDIIEPILKCLSDD